MKKYIFSIIFIAFCNLLLCSCNMNDLPKGEFVSSYISPKKTYTLNIYLCGGNATTDYSIRGEIVYNDSSETENVYWSYHEEIAYVEWLSDEIFKINNIQLDISKKETFDWRNE